MTQQLPPQPDPQEPQEPDQERRAYRKILLTGTVVLSALLLIGVGVEIGTSSSGSSSSDSSSGSSSSRTGSECTSTVTLAMDRSLVAFYGGDSPYTTTYGSSYYPGYYAYQVDTFDEERASLVSSYGASSGEVRAWDVDLAEVQRWHVSGTYTYNTMIDNGAAQVAAVCAAAYDY